MRSIERLRVPALAAALVLAGAAVAQLPDQKPGAPREPVPPTPISVDDIVERIMAFDKNKDGKVTRDELPERMHHLIELGDTNKDGALDRDEVKKLVAARATAPGGFGAGGFRTAGPGPGPGARGGFGVSGAIRGGGPGFAPGDVVQGVVDDLRLSGKKKDQALAAVKAHEANVRKLMEQARADLLQKMKEILSEEEFKDFKAALDRPRGGATVVNFGPPDAPRPGDVDSRSDPPRKGPGDSRR
jgi:hypothetical protein